MSCKKCKCTICGCIKNEIPKIAVNGIIQNPNEEDVVNIKVPTKTSQLINDSGFGQGNGGGSGGQKIENIRVNGGLVPIINKEALISVPTKTTDLTNDSNFVSKPYVDSHIVNKANPHEVTKFQVGLGNVDNTSDLNKPISTATQNALNTKLNTTDVKSEVIYQDLKPVNSVAIEKHSIKKINTVADLRATSGEYLNQMINLLGYYNLGDKESIIYKWTQIQGVDDGGSVINATGGSWIAQFTPTINLIHFGLRGDGTFDNVNVFNNINTYLLNNKPIDEFNKYTIVLPFSNKGFVTSSQLIVPTDVNLVMESPLIYDGVKNRKVIVIGDSSKINAKGEYKINIRSKTTDWVDPNYVGVEVINMQSTIQFDLIQSIGFNTGCLFIGDGQGFVYNTIKLGQLGNNKTDIVLTNRNNGWINENLYIGGRFHRTTSTNPNSDKYGVVITSEDDIYTNNNNNNFIKPSFEYNYSGNGETIPIVIKHGVQNKFDEIRAETGQTPYLIRTENKSTDNVVNIGYSGFGDNSYKRLVQDIGEFPTTEINTRKGEIKKFKGRYQIFNSGFLPKILFSKDNTHVYAPNEMFISVSSGANNSKNSASGITVLTDYVDISTTRGVGVKVDTSKNKRFIIGKNIKTNGLPGRIYIRCYNDSGTILTNDKVYVRGEATLIPVYFNIFGGVYRMGSDSDSNMYINLHEDVKYIDVIIGGGTSKCELVSFFIEALDFNCSIINTYNKIGWYSTERPTTTTYEAGTFVINSTNSKIFGWRYNGVGWIDIIEFSQTTSISNASSPNATDLASAITLINELKSQFNAKLTADRNSGQQAT